MSYLVTNPEDRFSLDEAQMEIGLGESNNVTDLLSY